MSQPIENEPFALNFNTKLRNYKPADVLAPRDATVDDFGRLLRLYAGFTLPYGLSRSGSFLVSASGGVPSILDPTNNVIDLNSGIGSSIVGGISDFDTVLLIYDHTFNNWFAYRFSNNAIGAALVLDEGEKIFGDSDNNKSFVIGLTGILTLPVGNGKAISFTINVPPFKNIETSCSEDFTYNGNDVLGGGSVVEATIARMILRFQYIGDRWVVNIL